MLRTIIEFIVAFALTSFIITYFKVSDNVIDYCLFCICTISVAYLVLSFKLEITNEKQ